MSQNICCACRTEIRILTTQRGWSFWLTCYLRTCGRLLGSGESLLVASVRQHDVVGGRRVLVSSAEAAKRRRRYDGNDPDDAGSGSNDAAGGFCVAPIGSA